MGWTPDAYFVNLVPAETLEGAMPYRALPDGTLYPVPEARGSWFSAGVYVIESNVEHTVLWTLGGAIRQIAGTFDDLVGTSQLSGWTALRLDDDRIELLPRTNIGRDPIPLFEAPTTGSAYRWPWFSPSGGGVAVAEYDEDWRLLSLDLLRVEEDVLVQRHPVDVQPGMAWEPIITDSGRMVVPGDRVLWTASFDEGLAEIASFKDEQVQSRVSEEEDLVVVGRTPAGAPTAYSVHDLRDRSSRALGVPASCELKDAVGEHGYFVCDGSHLGRVELRSPRQALQSLDSLLPSGSLELHRVDPLQWGGEAWHSLYYVKETDGGDGGVTVLLQADGDASFEISCSPWHRLFPVDD
ncbi:MAG: hypothetical protein ACRBN8_07250 [Nannocystales bacterium]